MVLAVFSPHVGVNSDTGRDARHRGNAETDVVVAANTRDSSEKRGNDDFHDNVEEARE